MTPEMALARTAARGGRYEVASPGGVPGFTAQDAAHALAGCSSLGARLVLLKFGCGDEPDRRRLAVELAFELPSLLEAPRYRGADIRGIDILTGAVAEAMDDLRCKKCGGSGYHFLKRANKVDPCTQCDGAGRMRWSLSQRARACNVDKMTLSDRSVWGKIYKDALALLVKEEAAALDVMAAKLRRGRG